MTAETFPKDVKYTSSSIKIHHVNEGESLYFIQYITPVYHRNWAVFIF